MNLIPATLRYTSLLALLTFVFCSASAQTETPLPAYHVKLIGKQLEPSEVPSSLVADAKTRIADPTLVPKDSYQSVSMSHEWYKAQSLDNTFPANAKLYFHFYKHQLYSASNMMTSWYTIAEVFDFHGNHGHVLFLDASFGHATATKGFLPDGIYDKVMADVKTRAETTDFLELHLLYENHEESLYVLEEQYLTGGDSPDAVIKHRYGTDGLYISSEY